MVDLLVKLENGLVEVSLVHLLPSCLHEREAPITYLFCLDLFGNLLLCGFSWWLKGFNHDGLVSPHDIRVVDQLG